MFKYNCLNPIAKVGLDIFDNNYEMTEDFAQAQGVLVRSAVMHEMELSDNLLCVARAGAGVNNIPLDKCADKGIVVFNTPGANANGVKELVLAGMLLASRDIIGGVEWVKENKADENIAKSAEKAKKAFAGTEIMGKTLGIIGLGAIGRKVADSAIALGMSVIGYDPYAPANLNPEVKVTSNLDDIYAVADFITIHVPAMDSTKGMINADALAKMKDGVIFLNFARDILVNENDMIAALKSGKVRKYVSDFANPTTAGQDGCIVIPHLGASTEESEDNCAVMAVKEMRDYLENGNIVNSVNFPRLDMGKADKAGRVAVLAKNADVNAIKNAVAGNAQDATKGDYTYVLIDTDNAVTDADVNALKTIAGVTKVVVVK